MKINWQFYEVPYEGATKEIPNQLEYLFSTEDKSEDVENFLYTELAPNIKHQYKIYNVIEPVINLIEFTIIERKKSRYKIEILNFLGYIFQEFIRDENCILVTPMEYQSTVLRLSIQYPDEFRFYRRFKTFITRVFPYSEKDQVPEVLFYHVTLNNKIKDLKLIINCYKDLRELLFAIGLIRFKNPNVLFNNFKISNQKDVLINLGLAINNMQFDKELAIYSLSQPTEHSCIWGNGFECVLATSSLMINSLQKDFSYQKIIIDKIMFGYRTVCELHNDSERVTLAFPPHKFMLEDLTGVLFHTHLGNGRLITKKELNNVQLYFYNLLSKEYRTHTYSLLYAGILPDGISVEDANSMNDIYNCYN